jgi:murein DD-endopeptidase MepM/ murein hydrolase activator NlpD
MAIGVDIIAAREGRVVSIRETTPDSGDVEYNGLHNYVLTQHQDRSTAFYAHLKQDSVVVEVGDWVEQGLPVNFSDTEGALDDREGLMVWRYYVALPY